MTAISPAENPAPTPLAVSVVIPARNAAATIAAQITALCAQTYDGEFEIIVVDNGSTDDTAGVARAAALRAGRELRIVREERPGVNIARNAGVRAARFPFVLLCDADDVVCDGWLGALATALRSVDYCGGSLDLAALNEKETLDIWGITQTVDCRSDGLPMGGNCGFWKEMWHRLGGFDERLSGANDETEFFFRARNHGYCNVIVPEGRIAYRLRPSYRQLVRTCYRHGQHQVLVDALRPGVRRQDPPLVALKAWAWAALNLPIAFRSRRSLGRWLRVVSARFGRVRGSIRYRHLYL